MIRLLIVDDSPLMRNLIAQVFEEEGGFEVHLAKNGLEAVEQNRSFRPDVVTLDINMPEMDGLAALSRIMADRPVPVVMVSSMTAQGALATLEALNLGAVDFITKSSGMQFRGFDEIRAELLAKVRNAHGAKLKEFPPRNQPIPISGRPRSIARSTDSDQGSPREGVVLFGASVGGPRTVEAILERLPADFPWPIVVAQHMPSAMTRAFAERLDQRCALTVVEATLPMVLEPGNVYLAKGDSDAVFTSRGRGLAVFPQPGNPQYPWHPSVELLGRSALEHLPAARVIGVMLTGLGFDGADAFAAIKKAGGRTIAESESSALVFGMPAELVKRDGANLILPLERIAEQLQEWVET